MRPLFEPSQGRIARAVVLYLSNDSSKKGEASVLVESIETSPWASLTFVGERHHLVVRLPGRATGAVPIEADDLIVPGFIVAVERADWATAADGAVVTLVLLAIATATWTSCPTDDPRAGTVPPTKLR